MKVKVCVAELWVQIFVSAQNCSGAIKQSANQFLQPALQMLFNSMISYQTMEANKVMRFSEAICSISEALSDEPQVLNDILQRVLSFTFEFVNHRQAVF